MVSLSSSQIALFVIVICNARARLQGGVSDLSQQALAFGRTQAAGNPNTMTIPIVAVAERYLCNAGKFLP